MRTLTILDNIQKKNSGLMSILKVAETSPVELESIEREHLFNALWHLANEVDILCWKIMPDEDDTQKEYEQKCKLVQQLLDKLDMG